MGYYNLVRQARRKQEGNKSAEEANKKHDAKQFGGQLLSWISSTSIEHVMLCLHEGTHLLYARACGFDPECYGPSVGELYYPGIGWRRRLGAVESLPHEIALSADVLLVAKQFLGLWTTRY